MRFKPVPDPPATLERLADVRAAVPKTGDSDADCCGRLVRHTEIPDRDRAADWFAFLRALELVQSGSSGIERTSRAVDRDSLRSSFRSRVVGAEAILDALEDADRPLEVGAVSDRVRANGRAGEYGRSEEKRTDHVRIERLLEWGVLLGELERDEDGFRPT